ncbi:DUF6114 domain-containing protein [Streptomyces sp. NPDC007863]|uniref:DUF6114 domain-containing protein n=1 Tax=Streptomyces sp. NPDC007863 TaxID=3154894 RepID=UPI0033FA2D6E
MVPPALRNRWRAWRRRRPFAAGLLLALAGAEILLVQRAGPAALATGEVRYAGPLVMAGCGPLLMADPRRRRLYGTVGVLASLASWVASDLGGLLLGMALGIAGGALALGRREGGPAGGHAVERPAGRAE